MVMHRLVPEFIQEQYAAARTAGSFDACALFVDISGFTPITDAIMGHGQHGAEVLANIIHDVFDPLMQSVFEQGGFVTNLAGDAFTAVFPANGRTDNATKRALAAAWQMQTSLADIAEHHTPYGTFSLSVKVGLAFGEIAWGIISSSNRERAAYYFQGPAIEQCSEAHSLALSGEVIADAAVVEALGPMVTAEPEGAYYRIATVNADLPPLQSISLKDPDPNVMNRFFPVEATREDLSGEFRQVASMFVSLPTVSTVAQLQIFMHSIFELQDHYGGLLNRLDFGDKGASLLLFWGAPVAHENDVARALNFVLDLQSVTVIPVNAGITYGIAHCGYSGGTLAGEYTCHGRGTTLAARFMQASPRGEVWVDERVAARAQQQFELELEGAMDFKGFAEEKKVFVLLERKEAIERLYGSQLVGRQTEQESLASFVKPLWEGNAPGIMVVTGEPGIGKSRLVHSFLHHLESSNGHEFAVFFCQSDEILRESLNPFRYWLQRYFGQSEQQSESRNKRSFNRKLDRLIARTDDGALTMELDRTRSFLGALVNLYWPDSLYEQLDAQGRYENSFTGLLTLLQAESLQRPLMLFLEDVQWLDGDSEAFLLQLTQWMTQAQGNPMAILATARLSAGQILFGGEIAYQVINLDRMSAADQESLAMAQLGSPIDSDLLELLVERAEGNPFFAEQILQYLQEQKMLNLKKGVWSLEASQGSGLPDDVRAVLVARLDQLTQKVKEVVQTASVLGREFEIQLLARMLHDDPLLKEKVMQAEDMAIWTALNELRYLFQHGLLRDAAYRMQVRSRRQALHKLAAEAIETLYEDDLEPHYGELAHHAEQAHLVDQARRYLELAGDSAKGAYQNSLALDYYQRALNLTPANDLESRYRLVSSRETLHGKLGARLEQAQDLRELGELADQLDDVGKQLKVLISKAWMYWWTAEYPKALAVAEQATILAEAAGQGTPVGQAAYVSAWVKIQQGLHGEARQAAERALGIARQAGDHKLESSALSILGLISRAEGDYFTARTMAEEALSSSRALGNRHSESVDLGNLGIGHMTLGDYQAAEACFRQGLAIHREMGSKVNIGSELINLCWNAETQGEWEQAIQYGEEGLAIVRAANQSEMAAEGFLWLGHAWLGSGQPEQAIAAYQDSLKIRRELGQDYLAMGVLAGMSRAAVSRNDLNSAAAYVAEILSFLDDGGSLGGTWEPLRILLTCYRVLELTQDPRAGEFLEIAYQELRQRADMIPDPETRRSYLENVPWHRELASVYREHTAGS